jgi:hypothetical protein
MSSLNKGHKGKSRQNQSTNRNARSSFSNGCAKLTGRVAALNRFIPKAAERSLPFFQVLRSSKNFQWSETQKQAFQKLKDYLSNMTKLCPPEPISPLLLYVSASNSVVSDVLVQEKEEEGKFKQIPVQKPSQAQNSFILS